MIKAIYFYDGPVYMAAGKLNAEKGVKFTAIDAGMGTTYNLEQVRFYSASADINILTNNPQIFVMSSFYLILKIMNFVQYMNLQRKNCIKCMI